jgi:hypothetical protein
MTLTNIEIQSNQYGQTWNIEVSKLLIDREEIISGISKHKDVIKRGKKT